MPDLSDDKLSAIKELNKIRRTGKFNMFTERRKVIEYANEQNMFNLVSYVENSRVKYFNLLEESKEYDLL